MNIERLIDLRTKLLSGEPLPKDREWDYSLPRHDVIAFVPEALTVYAAADRYKAAEAVFGLSSADFKRIFDNTSKEQDTITREDVAGWIDEVLGMSSRMAAQITVAEPVVDQPEPQVEPVAEVTPSQIVPEEPAVEETVAALAPPEWLSGDIYIGKYTVTVGQQTRAWYAWINMDVAERTTSQLAWYLSCEEVNNSGDERYETPAYKTAEKMVRKARTAGVITNGRMNTKSVWMVADAERNT